MKLLDAATANGAGVEREIQLTNTLKVSGTFGDASVTIQVYHAATDEWIALDGGVFSAAVSRTIYFPNPELVRAVISDATGATEITVEIT